MVMGFFHVRTTGLMASSRMGARKTVPSRIERMVPFGLFHISVSCGYSTIRCAFGVIGGADGPVALAMGRDIACSQVRREKERRVTWTLVCREKRKEDKTVTLLDGQKERII